MTRACSLCPAPGPEARPRTLAPRRPPRKTEIREWRKGNPHLRLRAPCTPRGARRRRHAHARTWLAPSARLLKARDRGGLHFPEGLDAAGRKRVARPAPLRRRRAPRFPSASRHARAARPWLRPRRPRAGARPGVRRAAARRRGDARRPLARREEVQRRRRCADPGRGRGEGRAVTFRRSGAQRAGTGRHEQRGRRRDRVRPRGRAGLGAREAGEPGRPGRH